MATKSDQPVTSKVQSIDRAVFILETLADTNSLGLGELSEKVGLHKATTHRIVQSLIENGLIEQVEENKQYRVSLRMFELGNKRVQNIDFINVAKSNIRQLSEEINQTVHLVIEDNDEILYIDKYGDHHESKMRSKIGLKAPLYCTAVGKAMLAKRSDNEILLYWSDLETEQKTEHTLTNIEQFMAEIEKVREEGYAVDDEEFEYGVFCVGSIFSSYKESVAGALSISLPIKEKPNKEHYVAKIRECAERISQLLGGTLDYQ